MAGNIKRPRLTPKIRNEAQDQKTSKIKRAFRSDDAYRVEAKKGGKMNAGLKAYLDKKKKKGKK